MVCDFQTLLLSLRGRISNICRDYLAGMTAVIQKRGTRSVWGEGWKGGRLLLIHTGVLWFHFHTQQLGSRFSTPSSKTVCCNRTVKFRKLRGHHLSVNSERISKRAEGVQQYGPALINNERVTYIWYYYLAPATFGMGNVFYVGAERGVSSESALGSNSSRFPTVRFIRRRI